MSTKIKHKIETVNTNDTDPEPPAPVPAPAKPTLPTAQIGEGETQRQRMKRRIAERKPTVIANRERRPVSSHTFTKIIVQQPLNYLNRAARRQRGMHKGLPNLFDTRRVINLPNHQKRVDRKTHKVIPFQAQILKAA